MPRLSAGSCTLRGGIKTHQLVYFRLEKRNQDDDCENTLMSLLLFPLETLHRLQIYQLTFFFPFKSEIKVQFCPISFFLLHANKYLLQQTKHLGRQVHIVRT